MHTHPMPACLSHCNAELDSSHHVGVRYLFSRDLVIAETFCRKLAWHQVP